MAGQGWIPVAAELLARALRMSAGTAVIGADFEHPGVVMLLVYSLDLPECDDAPPSEIPHYSPTITRVDEVRWDWGEPTDG